MKSEFKKTEIGMVPEDWNITEVESLVNHKKGFAFKSGWYKDKGVRIVKVSNLTNDSIDFKSCNYIDEELAKDFEDYELRPGDIIIATVGSWPSNPDSIVGKVIRVPKNTKKGLLNQNSVRLRVKDKYIFSQSFLYYRLKDKDFSNHIVSGAQGSANQASITLKDIFSFKFGLPNFEEQNAIDEVLLSLDEKIELNRQMNSTLEQIAQSLFKRWFIDFEFPNGKGNPYKSSGGGMVDSELGEIPEGWRVKKVDEILELAYGKALKEDIRILGCIPVYGSNGQVGWHNQKLVDGPGIVVGRKGNPGTVKWVHTHFYPIDTTFYVTPKGPVKSLYYILYALKKQDLPSLAADSAVPGLNRNMVYMNKMIVPERDVLGLFDVYLNNIFQKIQVNEEQSRALGSIRDSLLPKLMSGKIRIEC